MLVAPSTSQDPSTGCCARRCAGWPARRCACSRPGTGGRRRADRRARRTRGSSTGSPTRGRCRVRRRRLPRRPRDARARAGERLRGRGRARRPATWTRTPRGSTGPASACACRGACCAPGAVRLAVERALAEPRMRERAGELAAWWRSHDPPARASELIEALCWPRRSASARALGFQPAARECGYSSGKQNFNVRVMEPEDLAERLEDGEWIEAIARETGRDPSTVSYWVRKHGLTSSQARAPRTRAGPSSGSCSRRSWSASSRSAIWPTYFERSTGVDSSLAGRTRSRHRSRFATAE